VTGGSSATDPIAEAEEEEDDDDANESSSELFDGEAPHDDDDRDGLQYVFRSVAVGLLCRRRVRIIRPPLSW
jgi:hypothetical protein